ncbi:MAG: M1 family aminopeptidase [Bacteroidia bacterium]|nr:M1 family aminopeptidase [Bacteroidia bacterium]
MSKKGIIGMLFLMMASSFCYAQKFCRHMKMNQEYEAQNTIDSRADTFDVLHYRINASFLNYAIDKSIDAQTTLRVRLKKETFQMRLDLLELPVSSVSVNGQSAKFNYNSPNLVIDLDNVKSGDTLQVVVSYSGEPVQDPQWGGFYFSGKYAFNLGVGFASDPHNFGRVWFPCFDNFTDRATYDFLIRVDSSYKAYANGLLQKTTKNSDQTETFHWQMDDPIPTYLAAVAIAPYEEIRMNVDGIPVILTALASDTANLRKSFENLPTCIRTFESSYGKHTFDRVGFNTVPFNSGAMEHATNIAYPRYAIANGDKTSETLFAHELAHHWWGNTITCKTQEDMWLNEGWASYSERLFLEAVYGKKAYDDDIEANHHSVLQFAHVLDEAILPVSGIGHANTYGRHVYDKGADMVHTLRGFMGDQSFFEACQSFQSTYKFKDVTTQDMHTHFQSYTSLDLTGFFEQWVKTAGFAHFDILSVLNDDDVYQLIIKQTPRFNQEIYTDVRLSIAVFTEGKRYDTTITVSQSQQTFSITCPFKPEFWVIDPDDKISDATTTDQVAITSEEQNLTHGMMKKVRLVDTNQDSAQLWVTHHWAPADGTYGKPQGAQLSKERYWEVQGLWGVNTQIAAQLIYSGLKATAPDYGFLDTDLIRSTEDSLVLLHRPNAQSPWTEASDYSKNMGSLFDKRGTIDISNLRKGQYCLAMYDVALSHVTNSNKRPAFKLFPNPASQEINVELASPQTGVLEITNLKGQVIHSHPLNGPELTHKIDISFLAAGVYLVGISIQNQAYDVRRFVVE